MHLCTKSGERRSVRDETIEESADVVLRGIRPWRARRERSPRFVVERGRHIAPAASARVSALHLRKGGRHHGSTRQRLKLQRWRVGSRGSKRTHAARAVTCGAAGPSEAPAGAAVALGARSWRRP